MMINHLIKLKKQTPVYYAAVQLQNHKIFYKIQCTILQIIILKVYIRTRTT